MRKFSFILLLLFILTTSVCSQTKRVETAKTSDDRTKLTVRYIGNEGVLISSGDKQVLIDGLHREYKPAYAFPPTDLLEKLENARPPYDKINLLLVSHTHLDHFHPQSIGLHLKNNPQSVLVSSEQVSGEVAKNFEDHEKIKTQIKMILHEWKKSTEFEKDGIKIRFLGLRHANERFKSIQNFGHLIEIGGKKLLHIGDADMGAENFSAFDLSKEKIDIAFVPYWFLLSEDGRNLVKEQFNPKHIIAVHIPPNEAENEVQKFKKFYSDGTAFTKVLQEKTFK